MRAQARTGLVNRMPALMASCALLIFSAAAAAQTAADPDALNDVLRTLQAPASLEPPVVHKNDDGFIRFLGAPPAGRFLTPLSGQKAAGDPVESAKSFIDGHGAAFGVQSPAVAFESRTVTRGGQTFVRLSQHYAGLPVLGAEIVVQVDGDGSVRNISSSILRDTAPLDGGDLSLSPSLSAAEASAAAVRLEAGFSSTEESAWTAVGAPALMLYAPSVFNMAGCPVLVWTVTLDPDDPALSEMLVYVDAHTGALAFRQPLRKNALNREVYDLNGRNVETDDDLDAAVLKRKEGEPATGIKAVDDAYDYLGDTYNFYNLRFGRDGIDDTGGTLYAYVGLSELNAFYIGDNTMLFNNLFITDDVTAHELTHGVTDTDVGFVYFGFSGALSEMYSDWGGELVDLTNGKGNDSPAVRWFCAEEFTIKIRDQRGGTGDEDEEDPIDDTLPGIRYMKDPTVFGDPDRLGSPLLRNPYSMVDSGGVHSNSGVGNKLVYLLTDGDTFNGETVRGLGIDTVAQLFYNAMPLLPPSADYYDLYLALGAASVDIGLSFDDRLNVAAAGRAVEIEPPLLQLEGLRNFRAVATTDDAGAGVISLTWDNPPGELYSRLLLLRSVNRYATRAGEGVILPVERGDNSYLDSDVTPGVEYFYTIIADLTEGFPQLAYARATAGGEPPVLMTEAFGYDPTLGHLGDIDLAFSQITFRPVGPPLGGLGGDGFGAQYSDYEATFAKNVYAFPVQRVDAEGGAYQLTFTDDNSVAVNLPVNFPYFGKNYAQLFLAANGYISFLNIAAYPGAEQLNFPSLAAHFLLPRVSFCFTDFAPNMGGEAWMRMLDDRVVITYENMPSWPDSVPTLNVGLSSVQVELFYNGKIRMTYLELGVSEAVVGLSDGNGAPRDPSLEFAGLEQVLNLTDLTGLPRVESRLSINPVAPVIAQAGERVSFTVETNRPAGVAGLPVYFGEWTGPGAAPFADLGNGTALFNWQTALSDKGSFLVRVRARWGGQEAYQDIPVYIGMSVVKPSAQKLAVSANTPFEDPTQSRVVPLGRALTGSYQYVHPLKDRDPAFYAEGDSTIYWFRNGQIVYQLINRESVPAAGIRAGDRWWFGVVPVTVSGIVGEMVFSPTVTVSGFPAVTSITPAFGLTIGGDRVTIRGERLGGASAVRFGGVAGSNLTLISDTELQVTTPLHPAGVVDVSVESVDGIGLSELAFRFIGDGSDLLGADVNKDGRVDAMDVQIVTNAVLKAFDGAKAGLNTDVNGDGRINAGDIQAVVNSALNR